MVVDLLDESQEIVVGSWGSAVDPTGLERGKRAPAVVELEDSQDMCDLVSAAPRSALASRFPTQIAGEPSYGSRALESRSWRLAASMCSGSVQATVVSHGHTQFRDQLPIAIDVDSRDDGTVVGYTTLVNVVALGFACDVTFLHIPATAGAERNTHRCDVASVTPAASRASLEDPSYVSAPHEVATAKLATLLARVACLPSHRLRRAELARRLARGGAETTQDRLFRGAAQVSIADNEGSAADEVLAAMREAGCFRASGADVTAPWGGKADVDDAAAATAAAARVNAISAVAYAAENVRRHCFVCGALLAAPGPIPRVCGSDACLAAELHCLAYMDLPTELTAKGESVTAFLVQSALGAALDPRFRESLLDEAPIVYRRDRTAAPPAPLAVAAAPPMLPVANPMHTLHSFAMASAALLRHGYPAAAAAAAAPVAGPASQRYVVDWPLLSADLAGLAAAVNFGVLLSQPNIRAVRTYLAQLQFRGGGAGTGSRRPLDVLSSDPLADASVAGDWMDAGAARGGSASAASSATSAASSPAVGLPPPLASHNWPETGLAAGTTTPASAAAADPDRWLRLIWWVLRTVRCDFVPISAWSQLPSAAQNDATILATVRAAPRPASAAHPSIPALLGSRIHAFALHPHSSQQQERLKHDSVGADSRDEGAAGGAAGGAAAAPSRSRHKKSKSPRAAAPLPQHGTPTTAGGTPVTVFHGSKPSRWHAILRNGLRPLSNTAYSECGSGLRCMGEGRKGPLRLLPPSLQWLWAPRTGPACTWERALA